MSKTFYSGQDSSFNVAENGYESRFVQRDDSYFIIYLSSQDGCDLSCRMCHLTATGQTSSKDASLEIYQSQWRKVLNQVDPEKTKNVETVHVNLMARGEPLLNYTITKDYQTFYDMLKADIVDRLGRDVQVDVIISTIFPRSVSLREYQLLFDNFIHSLNPPRIYYSMYTADFKVRKKWLPKSLSSDDALKLLQNYDQKVNVKNKVHFPFIKGVNDSENDVQNILDKLSEYNLTHLDWNIVRYNPYSDKYSEETEESVIYQHVETIQQFCNNVVKVIPKVGYDIKASCGMFLELEK